MDKHPHASLWLARCPDVVLAMLRCQGRYTFHAPGPRQGCICAQTEAARGHRGLQGHEEDGQAPQVPESRAPSSAEIWRPSTEGPLPRIDRDARPADSVLPPGRINRGVPER